MSQKEVSIAAWVAVLGDGFTSSVHPARLLDEGVPVEELIERTWDGFAAMAMAEDALDDALTVLAWFEISAEGGE